MCDGVTQGEAGMELSLFSRDVIALATAVALSHQTFDAAVYLGICDKIVPGLVIGALAFGHLPAVFIPAGPMTSGLPNDEKARDPPALRRGQGGPRARCSTAEAKSYHGPGTCTFYGTANTNQMLMEIMGLHLPGAAFVNPNTPLRDALTREAAQRALAITRARQRVHADRPHVLDERAFVNGIVGLHATGGSTNHTIHLVAMAAAAGIALTWDDFSDLAEVVPLLCRVYPNGKADVNHFHAAGGMGFLIRELLGAGLLHEDVETVIGPGLAGLCDGAGPVCRGRRDRGATAPAASGDATSAARAPPTPFQATGGLRRAGRRRSAAPSSRPRRSRRSATSSRRRRACSTRRRSCRPHSGRASSTGDFVAVVRFQGPKANGMPELHKLMPPLGVLQDRGHNVALVTDGRLSGASGKVPAAIHVTPEALEGGGIARVRDGDIIRVDRRQRPARRAGRPGRVGGARAGRWRISRTRSSAWGGSCSACSAARSGARMPARR